jgi:hypothetical protein
MLSMSCMVSSTSKCNICSATTQFCYTTPMIAPYTVLLHGISGGISLFIFLWIEAVFRGRSQYGGKAPAAHYFAYWFLFFFLYNMFLTVPLALGIQKNLLGHFYNIAIVAIFVGSIYIIRVPFDVLFTRQQSLKRWFYAALWAFVVIVGIIQFVFPANPFLNATNTFIIWNPHPFAATLTTWGLIAVAVTFAVTFIVGAFQTKDRFVRIRSAFFTGGAIALAIATTYYGAKDTADVIVSMVFVIGGLILLALGLVIRVFKATSFSVDKQGT